MFFEDNEIGRPFIFDKEIVPLGGISNIIRSREEGKRIESIFTATLKIHEEPILRG